MHGVRPGVRTGVPMRLPVSAVIEVLRLSPSTPPDTRPKIHILKKTENFLNYGFATTLGCISQQMKIKWHVQYTKSMGRNTLALMEQAVLEAGVCRGKQALEITMQLLFLRACEIMLPKLYKRPLQTKEVPLLWLLELFNNWSKNLPMDKWETLLGVISEWMCTNSDKLHCWKLALQL